MNHLCPMSELLRSYNQLESKGFYQYLLATLDEYDRNILKDNEVLAPALIPDTISDQTAWKKYIYCVDPGCWPAVTDIESQMIGSEKDQCHVRIATVIFLLLKNNIKTKNGRFQTAFSAENL